jgi:hypothetical protein
MNWRSFTFGLISCFGLVGYSQKTVTFEKYKVPLRFHGKPVPALHNSPNSKTFRTKIREGVAAGPNFADHYTLAGWGCGSSCVMFSIVNLLDGKVYDFPFTVTWNDEVNSGVTFHRDSSAVRVGGYLNEQGCSAERWYLWDGTQLLKIAERPSKHAENSGITNQSDCIDP